MLSRMGENNGYLLSPMRNKISFCPILDCTIFAMMPFPGWTGLRRKSYTHPYKKKSHIIGGGPLRFMSSLTFSCTRTHTHTKLQPFLSCLVISCRQEKMGKHFICIFFFYGIKRGNKPKIPSKPRHLLIRANQKRII